MRAPFVALLASIAVAAVFVVATDGCDPCGEGTCLCRDGTQVRGESVPCACWKTCAAHGGPCDDPDKACGVDAGEDAHDDAHDAESDAESDAAEGG